MNNWAKYLYFSCLYILIWGTPSLAQAPLDKLFAKTGLNRSNVKVENMEAAHIPLVDAHNHLNSNMKVETLIEFMGKAGVKQMVLMPCHYKSPQDLNFKNISVFKRVIFDCENRNLTSQMLSGQGKCRIERFLRFPKH